MTLRIMATGVFLAVALLSAGCGGNAKVGDVSGGAYSEVSLPPELVAMSRPPIADLPVPLRFKLIESRSRNFQAAGYRYVDHVYTGRADKFAAARFYKRHMPISRWVLVTDRFLQGEITLDFEKETERSSMIISESGFWIFKKAQIKVQLWASGRIETPKPVDEKGKSGR